jgi:hypothetical protein
MSLGNYTESVEVRRLSGMIEQRGSHTGLSTMAMFLFGLPFAGFGAAIALVGLKVVPVNPSSVHAPYSVLFACGLVFGIGGLMIWGMAWRQFRANRHRAIASERHVSDPALEDYDWDPRGFRSHRWAKTVKSFAGTGFLALFLSMFNWWAWIAHGPWPVKIIVTLFDLWLAFAIWLSLLTFSRALRFGDSRIEFTHFPYKTNEAIVLRWLTPSGMTRADKGTFTLRCIREFYQTTGSGEDRTTSIVHEEQWSGTWRLDRPENLPPGKSIEFEFQPAAGLPATSLSQSGTFYWEFEVNLSMPGPDFKETYLVPVYS